MFRWKKNQKLKSFYLVSDSFLPPLEKGDTKAFNEGQKGHCFIAKEVQDYELCIKLNTALMVNLLLVWLYNVNVVVQFYLWFKFYFLLFLGMVMCDEYETKESKI